MPRQLLLASSSNCHPYGYLDHCEAAIRRLFTDVTQILFVPFARPSGMSHGEYHSVAKERFHRMGLDLKGIHEFADPVAAINTAQGVFIGGGNTFVLLRDLYGLELLDVLRLRIMAGMPYMGTSAGSNVAGLTIGTSNDMPIVQPKSFAALGVVPYNLNPHFPTAKSDPTHRGETRQDRIGEFHAFNTQPVVALHEDGMIRIDATRTTLIGQREAFVFRPGMDVQSIRTRGLCLSSGYGRPVDSAGSDSGRRLAGLNEAGSRRVTRPGRSPASRNRYAAPSIRSQPQVLGPATTTRCPASSNFVKWSDAFIDQILRSAS